MKNQFYIPYSKIKKETPKSILIVLKKTAYLIPKKTILRKNKIGILGILSESDHVLKIKGNVPKQIKEVIPAAQFIRIFAKYKMPKQKVKDYEKNI